MHLKLNILGAAAGLLVCTSCTADRPDFEDDAASADGTETSDVGGHDGVGGADDTSQGNADASAGDDGADETELGEQQSGEMSSSGSDGASEASDPESGGLQAGQSGAAGSSQEGTDAGTGQSEGVEPSSGTASDEEPMGTDGATPETEPPAAMLLGLGVQCAQGKECASGYCVDGVCCDTACVGVCSECNGAGSAGTCAAAVQDDACGTLSCPTDTECRTYQAQDAGNCDGLGQCATVPACVEMNVASGTACQSGAGTCDGSGQCVVPDKADLGESCGADDDCGSGVCAATASGSMVCCDQECDGTCEACGSSGFCNDFPEDDSSCQAITCTADSTCADYPAPLNQNRCAAFGQCVTEAAHCIPSFTSSTTSCGAGRFCDGMGGCEDACNSSQTWCTNACVNLDTDKDNCGSCGNECAADMSCVSGSCECTSAGALECSGSCIDPDTDADNCGSCGNDCGADVCQSGSCVCGAGRHGCGSSTPPCYANTDGDNCGSSCLDCSDYNGTTGTCGGDQKCECTGTSLACLADVPSCGSWDFENGDVGGWARGDYRGTPGAITKGPEVRLIDGSMRLAVDYNSDSSSNVDLKFDLCPNQASINVGGMDISFDVKITQTIGTDFRDGYVVAGSLVMKPCQITTDTGVLKSFSCTMNVATGVDVIQIALNVTPYEQGTVYIDNVVIE